MSRRARSRTSFLGLAFVLLALSIWLASSRPIGAANSGGTGVTGTGVPSGSTGSGGGSGFLVPEDFKVKLIRSDLTPEALAAAGVPAANVSAVLQAAADNINASPTALPSADTAFAAARVESDRLLRKIQSGLASQEEVSGYQSASASLASATSQRQTAIDAIFAAAVANLSAGQRAALTQIRANRAKEFSREFPYEFLVVERTEANWVALRDALANERLAVDYPDLLNETAQSRLSTARAVPAVAAAITSLATTREAVTAAWNTAAGQ